jgi:endonuclease/exonuclease/phosphatase family metal-dependent hydrolase
MHSVFLFIFLVFEIQAIEVSILTQNVWFIPFVSTPARDRAPLLVEELRKTNYDILCLQEVWAPIIGRNYVGTMIEGLRDLYPYVVEHPTDISSGSFLDSGLLLLSKYPVAKFAFRKYENSRSLDSLSDKGVLLAHIDLPTEGASMVIANTHFQAGGPDEVRMNQSLELVDALGEFLTSLGDDVDTSTLPVFAAGDFNTNEIDNNDGVTREPDYLQLIENLGATDLFRAVNDNVTKGYTTFGTRRLDYVFGLSGNYTLIEAGVDPFVNRTDLRLSDHLAAYATVDIEATSSGSSSSSSKLVGASILSLLGIAAPLLWSSSSSSNLVGASILSLLGIAAPLLWNNID